MKPQKHGAVFSIVFKSSEPKGAGKKKRVFLLTLQARLLIMTSELKLPLVR